MAQNSTIYTPQNGLYWLRKGTKNPVVLKTEKDLEGCKNEYDKSLRIACAVVNVGNSAAGISLHCICILSNRIPCCPI